MQVQFLIWYFSVKMESNVREKRGKLVTLIAKLQKSADQVERNILETEQNLNKDVVKINDGQSPLYRDSTNKAIENSLYLLNGLDEDAVEAGHLQHPQAEMIKHDMKQLRERVEKLRNDHNHVYHLTRSEGVPSVKWGKIIDEKMANLNSQGFGRDLPTIENEVDTHDIFHSEVEALAPYINQGDKKYTDGLQLKYKRLLESSTARQKNLLSLRDYMKRCTNELSWLDQQADERIKYDWSDANLDYPARKRQYENFISKCLESKEGTINELSDDGEKLLAQGHPGKNVIEEHMDAVHADWRKYLNLLICEENHLKHMGEYHKFQTEAGDMQDLLKRLDTEINQKYNSDFKDQHQLDGLLTNLNDQEKAMDYFDDRVKALQNRSLQVLPLKYRRSPPQKLLPIEALCDFDSDENTQGQIQRGERYTLLRNNGPKWDVKDSAGRTLAAPGVCFIIPPTDPDSVAIANNLMNLQKGIKVKLESSTTALQSRLEELKQGVTMPVQDAMVPAMGNEPAGPLNTVLVEVGGVAIQKKKKCTHCQHTQENLNEEDYIYKCEKCAFLQKSQSYACILSGRIVVLANGKKVTLMLTSPVIMKYLHGNNLGDLMEHPDSLEKHFMENAQFKVTYDGDVVTALTLIDQKSKN